MSLQVKDPDQTTEVAPETERPGGPRVPRRLRVIVLVALSCGVLAAAAAFAVTSGMFHRGTAKALATGGAQASSHRRGGLGDQLRVLSISPGNSADPVSASDPVRVVFSAPLAAGSPMPVLSPPVAGRWQAAGTEVTLRVPAGRSGVRSASGAVLASPAAAVFQAGGRTTLRLEALLSQLGYLPLTFTPDNGSGLTGQPGSGAVTVSSVRPALAGAFSWQGSYPAALTNQWQPGQPGVILDGAIMAFQADHQLPMTGTAGRGLWQALLTAVERDQRNANGYTFALASKAVPNTLTVWHNGVIVARSVANT